MDATGVGIATATLSATATGAGIALGALALCATSSVPTAPFFLPTVAVDCFATFLGGTVFLGATAALLTNFAFGLATDFFTGAAGFFPALENTFGLAATLALGTFGATLGAAFFAATGVLFFLAGADGFAAVFLATTFFAEALRPTVSDFARLLGIPTAFKSAAGSRLLRRYRYAIHCGPHR